MFSGPFFFRALPRSKASYFDLPLIFTLIGFLCVGSSLVITTCSIVDPFFVGE